jgi:hypothetical protein
MLGDVNALPRAERHLAAGDGYVQRYAVDHGFDMRGHIVGAFGIMNPACILGRDPFEGRDKIGLHVRIGILLNDKRRRGMPQIKQHDTIARLDIAQEARDLSRYFKKPSPAVSTVSIALAMVSIRAVQTADNSVDARVNA